MSILNNYEKPFKIRTGKTTSVNLPTKTEIAFRKFYFQLQLTVGKNYLEIGNTSSFQQYFTIK